MSSTRAKAAALGATLATGIAIVLVGPSSPALAYDYYGLHLDITAESPATLVSQGAAVDVPVDIECNADFADVYVSLTERVGSQTATGSGSVSASCTGGHQRILVRVLANSGKAFAKGTAAANAQIFGCSYFCGSESTDATIQITK